MKEKIIVALIGKAGAGKDTILNSVCAHHPEYHKIVSCTTRPMRANEKDGKDYHFISNDAFIHKILDGDMLEATEFNGWHYGTMKSDLVDGINIGVFNPTGYDNLVSTLPQNIGLIGIYIKCNKKERLMRQLSREPDPNVDEIVRRYSADEIEFINFKDDYPSINTVSNNTTKDFIDIVNQIPFIIAEECKQYGYSN